MFCNSSLHLPYGTKGLAPKVVVIARDWGKAIAIHELAPNLGFVASPFIAEAFLKWASWRGVF